VPGSSSTGSRPHGAEEPHVGARPAEVARGRRANLALGRAWVLCQQGRRGHDDAVDAVATLHRLLLEERLLERMGLLDRAESLERRDGTADRCRHWGDAGADSVAVQVDGAGAALREAATEARAVQLQLVAQHIKERRVI